MMKKLLLFVLPMLLMTAAATAQTVWDFSLWPNQGDQTETVTIDGLTIVPLGGSGFGVIEDNSYNFSDGFSPTKRFKGGGSSSGSATELPTRRYLTFNVTGDSTIKIWARPSGTSTPRALSIMDASANEVGHYDSPGDTEGVILEANYVGGATTMYVHFIDNAFNLYKIEATNVLSVDDFSSVSTNIKSINGRVVVSNVTTNTEIRIYSLTGALVKELKTNEDINFDMGVQSGLYIAQLVTSRGQKSVKLLIQ